MNKLISYTDMASVVHDIHRTFKFIFLFLMLYFTAVKCILIHDDAIEDIDEIFNDIGEDLSDTRLRNLFNKTDTDMDGLISSNEIKTLLENIRQTHAVQVSKERLTEYDSNNDGVVSIKEYFDIIYGNNENLEQINASQETRNMIAQSKQRDTLRWKYADFSQDGSLSLDELAAFENPEDYKEMKEYIVETTFQDLDANKDGAISLNEYLGSDASSSVAADELDFRERYFKLLKDRNKDGYLDMNEVEKWLSHSHSSRIDLETNGFIEQMDADKDGSLNRKEIINNWDKFREHYPDLKNILIEHDEL